MRPDLDLMSDADLITAVREGETEAFGVLYARHLHAAKRAASCLVTVAAEREDLVADAFLRVLRALLDGGGPNEEFRAYLLVTMRNAAISLARGTSVALYADLPESSIPHPGGDPMVNHWNAMTVASAFATLPERWRTVLWHTEVEEETPAEIAPLLGMRPNGVAALAYRAREGLRQAYLRAHLSDVESRECRATVSKLPGWVRRSVPVPLGRKISRHLAMCSDCRDRADTLSRVNQELRASLAPVVLGAGFAAAYVPVAAPVTGAVSGVVAVKTLLAKVGVSAGLVCAAVTTVVTAPEVVLSDPVSVPALADPGVASDSIEGPVTGAALEQPTLSDGPATVPAGLPRTTSAGVVTQHTPATGNGQAINAEANAADRAEKDAIKAERFSAKADAHAAAEAGRTAAAADRAATKAARAAAKAEKKAAKQAAKDEKKAAKGK